MNRRFVQIMLGMGLLLIGLNSITSGEPAGVILGLGGFYLLARQFEESRNNRERERDYQRWRRANPSNEYDFEHMSDDLDPRPSVSTDRVYSHALAAVQAAGLDASKTPVLPVDMGVLAHKGDSKPELYRTRRIPNDIDYIQPFVQLRLPTRATGKITFEIIDDKGETVFLRVEEHDLKRGRNLVIPSRRLPVHDALDMDEGRWTLKITAGDIPIAIHDFGWRETQNNNNRVAEHITDDGEISAELRAAMAEARLEDMSLDELLSFQEEEPAQQQRLS